MKYRTATTRCLLAQNLDGSLKCIEEAQEHAEECIGLCCGVIEKKGLREGGNARQPFEDLRAKAAQALSDIDKHVRHLEKAQANGEYEMELDEPDHSDDDMDSSSDQDDSWGAPLAGPPSDVASSSTPPQLP